MTFDGAPFDEALPGEAANIAFHLRMVALVSKAGEIIFRHDPKLAQVCECTNLRFAQRVFPVSIAIGRNRAVESATRLGGIGCLSPSGLALLSVCARTLTGPLHQVGAGFPVPSGWECEVGNAIGTVHDETPFGSPWLAENRDRCSSIKSWPTPLRGSENGKVRSQYLCPTYKKL